ncbi:MAG: hypothetical protein F4160_11935 [Rhodospirillaceae bacterium]|nr:hypothetical protein [Rhodospirillaceae bacterium]
MAENTRACAENPEQPDWSAGSKLQILTADVELCLDGTEAILDSLFNDMNLREPPSPREHLTIGAAVMLARYGKRLLADAGEMIVEADRVLSGERAAQ